MKIAQIAPIIERVPPKKYGGTERVVHLLTEELVKRGHEVTLFASGDSETSAKLVSVYPRALREAKIKDLYGANIFTMLNIGLSYSRQSDFDIIHDHNGHNSLPTANIANTPVVMTAHGIFTPENRRIFTTLRNPYIVTISQAQARLGTGISHIGTVHNGISVKQYPFSKVHNGYLLFVGRISLEKGVHHAIAVAQYLNLPLIIAAKLDRVDIEYFNEYINPLLSDQIRWIGEVDEAERNELYSRALCSLHPITWEEPFGLTIVEAMACGCPVIGFRLGSVPELILDGKTGFIVDNLDEMIEAVSKIDEIERIKCRQHVLENFSAEKMTDGYEKIYSHILSEAKPA